MFKPTRYDLTCDRNIASSSDHDRRLAAAAVARARGQILSKLSRWFAIVLGRFLLSRVVNLLRWRYFLVRKCVDARRQRGRTRVAAQQKARHFTHLFFHKYTLLSIIFSNVQANQFFSKEKLFKKNHDSRFARFWDRLSTARKYQFPQITEHDDDRRSRRQ